MAKITKGILGAVSGKVGSVVGSSSNEVSYIRSLPAYKKNRKVTAGQRLQRAKFRLAADFLRALAPLIEYSYQSTPGLSERSVAVSNLLTQSIGGVYPNLVIDYSTVQVARGKLKKASNAVASSINPGELRFLWNDNTGLGNANTLDKAILVAYCKEEGDILFTIDGATRAAEEDVLEVSQFAGRN